jgi:hypothetical protein
MRIVSPKGAFVAVTILVLASVAYVAVRNIPAPEKVTIVAAPVPAVVHAVIGKSVQGRDIDAYTYGTGPTRLLFVGGIHGGYEWNSVVLAYNFKDYLDSHPALVPKNISVTVIPSLNPDGMYKVTGKEGPVSVADIPKGIDTAQGRVNANGVDLNRNFACHWQSEAVWRSAPIGAGSAPFSEPESIALRDYIAAYKPAAAIFWHSQSGSVYSSECDDGVLPQTLNIMQAYANAAGYGKVESFDAYPVTGDAEGWLASIGIPAITVELTTHSDVEWSKNIAGIAALLDYYSRK